MADINDLLENESLKKEFEIRDLDLAEVFSPTPDDLKLENRRLKHLLDWVNKYSEEGGNRKKMEADGYVFPPIDPCIDPDEDWYIFERWINGLPTTTIFKEHLPQNYTLKNPEELSDEEIENEIQTLTDAFEKAGSSIVLQDGIPPRLVYQYLLEEMDGEQTILIGGGWFIDGCTGSCPDCFQRPWCKQGGISCWDEDNEAGKMYLCDILKDYVSASTVSLHILQNSEAEEKMKFENTNFDSEQENMNDDEKKFDQDFFDTDNDDDIPF